jgi:hypothetical protein
MRSERAECGRCGKDPAEGFAEIDGVRYCHGTSQAVTCYENAVLSQGPDDLTSAYWRVERYSRG